MALQLGQILDGKYKIVRQIGEGGMGAVYEGENVLIRRRVAIKLLHTGVAANAEMVQRFEREAQVAGTVGNDHILEILDLGALPDGDRYMVMEFLDGEPLSDRIRRLNRLEAREASALVGQILRGLGAAHGAGVVHRDLKPDNIFVLKSKAGVKDFVKIIDFGISKFVEPDGTSARMTRTGALMGTPHYMAPEQAAGSSEIDRRTDIYAVGIILYECLTGRVPFQAETFNQLLFEIALAKLIPARTFVPDLDLGIETILLKAAARDPVHRFQTCEEFAAALEAWEKTGSSVSLPPEASLESIVAATVPRAARPATGSMEATVRAPSDSVSGVTGADAMPPRPATVNTWANTSQATGRKQGGPPVLAATIAGIVLLLGSIAGVVVFRHKAESSDPVAAASAATPPASAVPVAAPSAEAAPVIAPASVPSPVDTAAAAPAPAEPRSKSADAVASKRAAPRPPIPVKVEAKAKTDTSKPKAINFGY